MVKKPGNNQPLTNENGEQLRNRVASTRSDAFQDVCDDIDDDFFSFVGELKIDRRDSEQVVNDGDSDCEQYFSLQ